MAKTGSIGIVLNSQSIANNTSNITVKGTITTSGDSYRGSHRTGTYTVKQGSTVIYNGTFTCGAPANTTTTLFSKTLVVTHDAVGASGDISVSYNYDDGWCTASGSAGLPTIPRKSELTVANGTLGTAQTLTVTKKSTTFTHTITATCGEASTTICTKSSSTSISFTPPLEWARQLTSGTAVTVKYTITTYNGSTSVGSNTYTKTCAIPASVVPTVSLTVEDAMGYFAKYGAYVQGKSKFKITVSALGELGSTIKSYSVSANGKTYTTASVTTDVISSSGTLTIKVTVTDSRGRTATASQNVTVLAYSIPKISAMTVKRCNSNGASNSVGAYLCVTFTASATSLNSKNTAAYVLKYKKKTATTYTSATLTNYANNYTVTNGTYIFAADTGASYDVVLTLTDAFTSASNTQTGKSASKLFSVFERGLGWAFGKGAERENALEIAWDIYDKHDTQIRNGLCAYESAGIDANTTLEHCFLTNVNTPTTSQFWYIEQFFYNTKSATANRMQVAYPYKANDIIQHRYYLNGAWSDWLSPWKLPVELASTLKVEGLVTFDVDMILENNTWIRSKKTDGEIRNLVNLTNSNEYMFGYGSYQHSEGNVYYDGNSVIVRSRNSVYQRIPSGDMIFTTDRMRPSVNDTYYLGDSSRKWKAVYAVNGSIQTSDRNQKENINGIAEKYEALFSRLQPVTFELKGGEHDRVHVGFIAQDVKEAMEEVGLTNEEFAAYCVDTKKVFDEKTEQDNEVLDENGNPIEMYSLRYTEFIALNTHMIQKQQAEIDALKQEIEELKNLVKGVLS